MSTETTGGAEPQKYAEGVEVIPMEQYLAEQQQQVLEQVEETPTETTDAPEVVETAAPETPAAPSFDFSRYGAANEDELAKIISDAQETKAKLAEFEQIKSKIANPFANERIAQINNIVREIGVSEDVAAKLVKITPEKLQQDPVEALTLKMVIDNPAALDIMDMNEIREAVVQKYGLEEEDGKYVLTPAAKLDLAGAIKEVQQKLESAKATPTDVYASLQQEFAKENQGFQQKVERANQVVEKAVSGFKNLNLEVNGEKIEVAVSQDNLKLVQQYASQLAAQLPENENYESTVNKYIVNALKTAHEADIFKAYHAKVEGRIREEAVKSAHNGGPVTHKDKPVETKPSNLSDGQQAQLEFLKKHGLAVPNIT
jgi:hypothetical protein